MKKLLRSGLVVLSCLGLAGCAAYEAAEVSNGVISNPTVGWAGYSIAIPDGLELVDPHPGGEPSNQAAGFQSWYSQRNNRWVGDYNNAFTERFVLKNPERTFTIVFLSETYELAAGWSTLNSMRTTYVVNKAINRKKVVINDDDASSRQVEVNGHRGWAISGTVKPYSKKEGRSESEYEGYYVLGGLKEAYWVEGFGPTGSRAEMRRLVLEMIESLQVHDLAE